MGEPGPSDPLTSPATRSATPAEPIGAGSLETGPVEAGPVGAGSGGAGSGGAGSGGAGSVEVGALAREAGERIAALATSPDPDAFAALLSLSEQVGVALGASARTLATHGSWSQVAEHAGTTRQAAWARWH